MKISHESSWAELAKGLSEHLGDDDREYGVRVSWIRLCIALKSREEELAERCPEKLYRVGQDMIRCSFHENHEGPCSWYDEFLSGGKQERERL